MGCWIKLGLSRHKYTWNTCPSCPLLNNGWNTNMANIATENHWCAIPFICYVEFLTQKCSWHEAAGAETRPAIIIMNCIENMRWAVLACINVSIVSSQHGSLFSTLKSKDTAHCVELIGNIRSCSKIATDRRRMFFHHTILTPPWLHAANVTCNGPWVFLHARKLRII